MRRFKATKSYYLGYWSSDDDIMVMIEVVKDSPTDIVYRRFYFKYPGWRTTGTRHSIPKRSFIYWIKMAKAYKIPQYIIDREFKSNASL